MGESMKFSNLIFLIFISFFTFNSTAEIGGISGGGGGTITPGGVDTYKIKQIIGLSKILLLSWLNDGEHFYKTVRLPGGHEPRPEELLLFKGPRDVFEVIRQLKIEVKNSSPCYTFDGQPVDGSINATKPADICISAKTLAEKLNENNFEYETIALIMHEIMHLLGANEERRRLAGLVSC